MYEHKSRPLLSKAQFLRRIVRNIFFGLLILLAGLGIGMVGYHVFEGLSWVDSYANAAMILSGMGPLTTLETTSGKLFAGTYALFSGLTFITVVGVVLTPIVHRFFHSFHLGG